VKRVGERRAARHLRDLGPSEEQVDRHAAERELEDGDESVLDGEQVCGAVGEEGAAEAAAREEVGAIHKVRHYRDEVEVRAGHQLLE